MKFLRILIITACLNVPFAYGMDQPNMLQTIKSATKMEQEKDGKVRNSILFTVAENIIRTGGVLAISEGIAFAGGFQPIFIPKMSEEQSLGAATAVFLTTVSAGVVILAYTL